MWIVPISTGSTKNAFFSAHTRTVIKEKVFVCPQVIGKAALITRAEVTEKGNGRILRVRFKYEKNKGIPALTADAGHKKKSSYPETIRRRKRSILLVWRRENRTFRKRKDTLFMLYVQAQILR